MESNLKARAFAAYLGSTAVWPVYHQDSGYDYKGGTRIVLGAASYYDAINSHSFELIKLELKPLSSISEPDAIEVAKLSGSDTCTDYTLSKDGEFIYYDGILKYRIWFYDDGIGMDISKNGIWHDCTTDSSFWWNIADYLRSRSYNLPFMGKDLIKENIAIIKTDIK